MLTCLDDTVDLCFKVNRTRERFKFPQLWAFLSHDSGGPPWTFSVVSGERNSPISLLLSAEDFRGKLANGADADRSRPLIRGCAGTARDWLTTQCEA
jgi:hypothetical protein